jgi:hypothetical protein
VHERVRTANARDRRNHVPIITAVPSPLAGEGRVEALRRQGLLDVVSGESASGSEARPPQR